MTLDLGKGVKLDLVWIPPGEFNMGDSDNGPVHWVKLTKGFWMGKYEVTQEQYETVIGSNPSRFKGPQNPVDSVSWNEAYGFARKVNSLGVLPAGVTRRLPTEAEWEYGCRAGTTTPWWSGGSKADFYRVGWGEDNSRGKTQPVGQKEANRFGLHDVHGNVWEWCADWYGLYSNGEVVGPNRPCNRQMARVAGRFVQLRFRPRPRRRSRHGHSRLPGLRPRV
ncbi:MAG: formylglycine-generating enzyme family protein, partial [Verrucomicrobia bacterium]|nr:formylglycine-generating enzyme family protein [Verrucomicrobiota bacterium]